MPVLSARDTISRSPRVIRLAALRGGGWWLCFGSGGLRCLPCGISWRMACTAPSRCEEVWVLDASNDGLFGDCCDVAAVDRIEISHGARENGRFPATCWQMPNEADDSLCVGTYKRWKSDATIRSLLEHMV